jgi:hypothetical protein
VVPDGKDLVRMRVSREGGAPTMVARSIGWGPLSPDGQYSFTMLWQKPTLRWFTASGELLGEVRLPQYHRPFTGAFAAGGKYIVGASTEWGEAVKIVPVAGGPVRHMNYHPGEYLRGWSADGKLVRIWTEKNGDTTIARYSLDGLLKNQIHVPNDADLRHGVEIWEGHLVYWAGNASTLWRLMALSFEDSSRRELARNVWPAAPLTDSWARAASIGQEFHYWQMRGDRAQLRAIRMSGQSRVIGEIAKDRSSSAVAFQSRIAYQESDKDSVRVQLVSGAGRAPQTLATFKSDSDVEYDWSHDGRLAVSAGYPRTLLIYHFDADGNVQGSPQSISLPFERWSPIRWLPDGSGLTMVTFTHRGARNEVALVRLADPQHPVLLTSGDPSMKSGYRLSRDGRFVLYRSTPTKASSIFVIDVAEMQMQMRKHVRKNK